MNLLDLVLLAVAIGAIIGGWRLGFLARVASWMGLAAGIYLAYVVLPPIVRRFQAPGDPSSGVLIVMIVLLAGAAAGQAVGMVLGNHVHKFVPKGPLRLVDSATGSLVGLVGTAVLAWILVPSMADIPGWPARQARNSAIGRQIAEHPPRSSFIQSIRGLVTQTNGPRVFTDARPAPETDTPPATSGLAPEVQARVLASTVKIEGEACRRIQEGSGFASGPDTVVTNAHVVAGDRKVSVQRPDGRALPATVVLYDPNRDLAVLRVPGLGLRPLAVGKGKSGTRGAVFGHPGGQEAVRVAPAAIRQEVDALGRDIYDQRPTRRQVFILASLLRAGDSGGPLVDRAGAVVGVVFAIAPDQPATAYALTSAELDAALVASRNATAPASTRGCVAG